MVGSQNAGLELAVVGVAAKAFAAALSLCDSKYPLLLTAGLRYARGITWQGIT